MDRLSTDMLTDSMSQKAHLDLRPVHLLVQKFHGHDQARELPCSLPEREMGAPGKRTARPHRGTRSGSLRGLVADCGETDAEHGTPLGTVPSDKLAPKVVHDSG